MPDFSSWAGQYLLSAEPVTIPGWTTHRVAGRHLAAHPALPVVPVTVGGTEAGVLLGWPIDPGGRLVERLALAAGADPVAVAYTHGGRWLLVTPDAIYPDPVASQPAVYCAELHMVASSPGLIPAETDEELAAAFDVVARSGWYPFGLTPKRGVQRLLPNHRLALGSFEARRDHLGPEPGSVTLEEAAEAVISAVRAVARAFADPGLLVGLTAGYDSRMLLAALRPYTETTEFVTSITSKRGANLVDVRAAQALARRYGLIHSVAERRPATEAERREWLERTGWVAAGGRTEHMPDKRTRYEPGTRRGRVIDEDGEAEKKVFAHGATGALTKAKYWQGRADLDAPLTARELVSRVGAPAVPSVLSSAEAWLASVPNGNRVRTLILLYLEQRIGAWASPALLSDAGSVPTVYPLNSRDAIDALLGVSAEERIDGAIHKAVIQRAWPELLELPFNEPVGWHRVRRDVTWMVKNPRFTLGALRRKLGLG